MTNSFHFIAIGGVGQSALAKILLQLGFEVSGSDIEESKYTKLVEKLGAKISIGHDEKNIKQGQTVVISSAIKEDNPELKRARELNLKVMHRSDCLDFISRKFPCFVGFAGTHGKTTTSGLMSFILEKMQKEPAYAIGGIIPKINENANASKTSKYFIAELDESDGTIEKYAPNCFVVNNLEADHLDFYKNGLEDIIKTFKKTINNMQKTDKLFINFDDDGAKRLLKESNFENYISFAINSNADYQAKNIVQKDLETEFDVYKNDKFLTKINLIIPGVHNVYNTLSVISVLDSLGFKQEEYAQYFSEFSGMGRRFQLYGEINDIKIIDDYAHHPTEVNATIQAISGSKRRKLAIFQPHRYTRLEGLWQEFIESFKPVDKLYVLDVFNAGKEADIGYNSNTFAAACSKNGIDAKYIKGDMKKAAEQILPDIQKNDLVITLGAGDNTKICGEIYDLLSK